MAVFGGRSLSALKGAHPDIQRVMHAAIIDFDFMVLQSSRTKEEQEADFAKGVTKAHWLQSAHDYAPSLAVDCCPYPVNWSDTQAFAKMAAVILAHAREQGVNLVWGGSWKMKDYPHFEIEGWRAIANGL